MPFLKNIDYFLPTESKIKLNKSLGMELGSSSLNSAVPSDLTIPLKKIRKDIKEEPERKLSRWKSIIYMNIFCIGATVVSCIFKKLSK